MRARENESPRRGVVTKQDRLRANIRIVAMEVDSAVRGTRGENQDDMVHRQTWKRDDVDDREASGGERFLQLRRGLGLAGARERENHPPVSPLRVTLPGAAAILPKEAGVGRAELTQIGEAGNGDVIGGNRRANRASTRDEANVSRSRGIVQRRTIGKKGRVEEELPRGADDDETVVRIRRRGIVFAGSGFAGRGIELVFPDEFVRIGKRVGVEVECSFLSRRGCNSPPLLSCLHLVFTRRTVMTLGVSGMYHHLNKTARTKPRKHSQGCRRES